MKQLFFTLLAVVTLTSCARTQNNSGALHLAQNGETAYVIALANDAIPAEETAAEQLQKYFQQVTGASISIQPENAVSVDAPQILVGAGERVRALVPRQAWSTLGSDGIVIKTVGKNLVLAGGRPRGTLYAVFQFLEDSAGCRWWTSTENTIPRRSTFDVAAQNVVYVPPFDYREHYTNETQADPVFATIMRENGHHQRQTPEWGGHYSILGFVHTFTQLLPPEKYFKEHPDWFSDPANGNKPCTASSKMPRAQDTQLNLSHPEVLEELTKQALALIEKKPQAGYISISQNDNANYCRDEASMKLAEEEGSQAAPVLNFVNKVAEKIHQRYPDFKVETLAYVYTEKPPKTIRPGKNVIIRLAPISSDFGHPLNSDWNRETRDNLLGWSKIAPQLFVWNYATNFTGNILPHPNWLGLGSDLRFFAAHNVKGVFEQGDAYTNGVGDFAQLRTWLVAHLMWNPDLDQEKLTDEFLQGYYGAAAPYLKQYLNLIQQSFLSEKRGLSTFNRDFSFITLDVANTSKKLFDQAEAAVKDSPDLLRHVQRERLSITAGVLYRYKLLRQTATREKKAFLGPSDPRAAMAEFIKAARSFGIRDWKQGSSFDKFIPYLEDLVAPQAPLPDFAQNYPDADVIDIQESKYSLYRLGTLSEVTDDPAASNGKTASIVGDTNQWAIQARVVNLLDAPSARWHVYVMARAGLKTGATPTGEGLSSGIHDVPSNKPIGSVTVSLKEIAGEQYQRVDLGVHQLSDGMYIWVAPTRNPAVDKIYVDRIILIREK